MHILNANKGVLKVCQAAAHMKTQAIDSLYYNIDKCYSIALNTQEEYFKILDDNLWSNKQAFASYYLQI